MEDKQNSQTVKFQRMFQKQANTRCLQCGKNSRQWADLAHAIFLCPDCATSFREFSWATRIKSVSWEQWSDEEVNRLEKGGNQSFQTFLKTFNLEFASIRTKVGSRASTFYRRRLSGEQVGVEPSVEEGCLMDIQSIPLSEMRAEEMLESAKGKALWLGGKTKSLGESGIRKVQQKWESGDLKGGAKQVAETVSGKAKWLWGKFSEKVNGLTTSNKVNNNP